MKIKELIEKLKEFPEGATINWSVSLKELGEPITFSMFDQLLRISFDSIEVDYDSCYDYYDECPDCGKDLT